MVTGNNPRGQQAVRISAAFSVVGNLIVLCRLYIRFIMIKSPGAEDLCIAVAMLFSTAFTVLVKVQADAGLGIHAWELTNDELLRPLKSLFSSVICYYLAIAFTKASILLQYHRIFSESRVRNAIYILGAIVFAYSIETILATVFLCIPVQKFWEPSIPGSCANKRVLWFTNSALHIATDFAIVILPMPVLKNLNLPSQQKRALIFVFAIGGFACAVSIIRLHSLAQLTTSKDLTYDNADTATWSAGELNISLVCACLPALRPVISRLLPGIFATSNQSNTEGQFKMTSRRQATSGGSRIRTARNPFDSSELTDQQKGASDDKLPLQSKCWAHHGSEQDEMVEYGKDAENAQIMVVTDVHQQVANRISVP